MFTKAPYKQSVIGLLKNANNGSPQNTNSKKSTSSTFPDTDSFVRSQECSTTHTSLPKTTDKQHHTTPYLPARKPPLHLRYSYNKRGNPLLLATPKIRLFNREIEIEYNYNFSTKEYHLSSLSDEEKQKLREIEYNLDTWQEKIQKQKHKTPAMERVKHFSKEITTSILNAINDRKRPMELQTYKDRVLFAVYLPKQPIYGLECITLSGISLCTINASNRLIIDINIVNPEFLPCSLNPIQVRGTGTALIQAAINFIESSPYLTALDTYPADEASAHISYKLGFSVMGMASRK